MKRELVKRRFKEKDEAAIGIGTLIVFIGLILVAAVASAVMIHVAHNLQQRGKKTGREAEENIIPPIEVQRVSGNVDSATENITEVQITVTLLAGREAYNIVDDLIIQMEGTDNDEPDDVAFSEKFAHENSDSAPGSLPTFEAWALTNPHDMYPPRLDTDSIVQLNFTSLGSDPELGNGGLSPASSVSIYFMPSKGGTGTLYETTTPSSYPTSGWVNLP